MQSWLRSGFRFFAALLSIVAGLHPQWILRSEEPLPDVKRLETSPVLRHLKRNPIAGPPATPAEATVAQMYLPPGFRARLVAAEPDVHQPIAFAFDDRGRIWVAEAYSYPQKRPPGQGQDQIVIFSDSDNDGRFETRKVFAKGLNLVSGFELGYGGVWVGAAPELLFIPDANQDDIPDGDPAILLDGFGYQDTHECLNSFMWGPDGWLYGNQGVFNYAQIGKPGAPDTERVELRAGVWRYHPVRHEFEVFAHGGSNQWGLDFDERGQIFMTHCRSYWGRGGTTHVIQGGHFWNQANANYGPFIIANPPPDFPEFKNYLLASARYDHGAGGAGERGSDAIYGGHSHVGTMLYFGDNWPDEYRGHLFTHNLGGHQINHQVNRRLGSGFDTVHAGADQFFCSDPRYVAIDLQYGPDGAVYTIDWYDQQHCHNPNTERWDRGNGRIYRIEYADTYRPKQVSLRAATDLELAELHAHKNEWHVRTARRLLHERSLTRSIDPKAQAALERMALQDPNPTQRLRALWTWHALGKYNDDFAARTLKDTDEYVRGWSIQLLLDDREISAARQSDLIRLAETDPSPVVRLYLASAVQRLPEKAAWAVIEKLAAHGEDRTDRNLPYLLWQGMAFTMTKLADPLAANPARPPASVEPALRVAATTQIPQLAEYVYWYLAGFGGDPLDRAVATLDPLTGDTQRRRLAGLGLAIEARPAVQAPESWRRIGLKLYAASDPRVRRAAERIGGIFGDTSIFPRLRETLARRDTEPSERQHAFHVLSRAQDRASLPVFISLLDDPRFRTQAVTALGRFDSAEVADALIARYEKFSRSDRAAVLNTLTTRATFALRLLQAVANSQIPRADITAFHIRQMDQLRSPELNQRLAQTWGRVNQSAADKQQVIEKLEKIFNEAPLWAYSAQDGRRHFQLVCASCHQIKGEGTRIGPELTGAGANGIRYYLENIIDPNAVVGTDYEMIVIERKDGEVVSGLLENETPDALTIRTVTERAVVAKSDVAQRKTSGQSMMPEGLLNGLNDREQLELLKFLTSN